MLLSAGRYGYRHSADKEKEKVIFSKMKLKNIFIGMVAAVIAAVSMIFTVSADFGKMNELSGATFTLEGKLSSSIRPKIAATLQGVYVFSQDGYFAAKRLNSTIGS